MFADYPGRWYKYDKFGCSTDAVGELKLSYLYQRPGLSTCG